MEINIPSNLSDQELVSEVRRLAARERDTTASLVAHLAELDSRRLYLGAGFSSLYTHCREGLQLSEDAPHNRMKAAQMAVTSTQAIWRKPAGPGAVCTVSHTPIRSTPRSDRAR